MVAKNPKSKQIDKIQQTLNIIDNFKKVYHCFTTCKVTLNVSAMARLISLIIVWINQILVMFGVYEIPMISEAGLYVLASGLTIITTLWSYWTNNSWTDSAKMSDAILQLLQDTNIDTYQLLDAIKTVVDEAQIKNKRDVSRYIDEDYDE